MALLLVPASLFAQIKVTAQAPSQTEEGQRIRVSYVVNTQDIDDFQVGEFDGFEVLYGPSQSSQSSFQIINGKTTSSSSVTFSYTLLATKEGTHKLPAATVKSGGKTYRSNQPSVQILQGSAPATGGGQQGKGQQQQQQQATRMRTQNVGDKIQASDLYVTATASKHRVYEQEAILLTYKLFTLVNIEECTGDLPELDGFHTQEIDLPKQKSLTMERINGRTYGTTVWRQYVLFPQKTGKITIPAVKFEAVVVQQERSMDPFEAFFGGGSSLHRINKTILAPAVTIDVDALPARPANFSGAVGSGFKLSATLTPEQVDANDAVTLKAIVSGTGNMKLMKAPFVAWPKDFETYDPKVNDQTKISPQGATGNVIYNYTTVPRHGGKYSIAPVEFCYFDTQSKQYKTLRTDSFHLAVAKGAPMARQHTQQKEDLKVLNSDIRYIKTGNKGIRQQGASFFATPLYWGIYVALTALFVVIIALFYRQAKLNANVAHRRGKKASKAASKRLKTAAKLLKSQQPAPFYDEVMRALWGYVADKLNLPVAELNKDNVADKLQNRGVSAEQTEQFLRVLSDCEFARFAPGDASQTMDKLYSDATEIINVIDNAL